MVPPTSHHQAGRPPSALVPPSLTRPMLTAVSVPGERLVHPARAKQEQIRARTGPRTLAIPYFSLLRAQPTTWDSTYFSATFQPRWLATPLSTVKAKRQRRRKTR